MPWLRCANHLDYPPQREEDAVRRRGSNRRRKSLDYMQELRAVQKEHAMKTSIRPTKTQVSTEKVEVVRQVRLTSKQRLTLVEMQNSGGRSRNSGYMNYTVRQDLQALGLIEERLLHTASEKKAIEGEISALWKAMPAHVKTKDASLVERQAGVIYAKLRSLDSKAWWLTKAAEEYLVKGKVMISR